MIRSKHLAVIALATLVSAATVTSASAQNPNFELGNLFLGFQATGGVGSTSNILSNLGDSALDFRDASANQLNIVNIGSQLTAQFGANWYERTDLFTGAGASFERDEFAPVTERNGDQFNTLYITKNRSTLGTPGVAGSNAPTTIADPLTQAAQQQASDGLWTTGYAFAQQNGQTVTIANSAFTNDYDNNNTGNSVASWNSVFAGGTQAAFGVGSIGTFAGIAAEAALDLYRIDPSNGVSSYEGTIVIDNLGNVSFINQFAPVPEPTTALGLGLLVGMVGLVKRRRTVVA